MKKVVVFGPGPRFKGGIAHFTTSLCIALHDAGADVTLVSWSRQYPSIIPRDFEDKASKSDVFEGRKIAIHYLADFNLPATWKKTADFIASQNPHLVIFQWAIALQGLPMGRMAKQLKRKSPLTEILFDVHNVVQKEGGRLDRFFTRNALEKADSYVVHGQITIDEFTQLLPEVNVRISSDGKRAQRTKTMIQLFHPVYDMFRPVADFDVEAFKKEMGLHKNVFLFFGFIRKYKGLHLAIKAFSEVIKTYPDCSLLIVGESFWDTVDHRSFSVRLKKLLFRIAGSILLRKKDQEKEYRPLELIKLLGIESHVCLINRFVPNEEVYRYFQVSDAVINFYEYATPSGVESIAYNFGKPILATPVGHFKHAIKDGINGYLAESGEVKNLTEVIERFIENPVEESSVRTFASQQSWEKYAQALLNEEKF
jgi:glycosyltransferase involved in cell wall biosynthesis